MLEPRDRLVVFDLETGGLDPQRHPVIQFAAVALDGNWQEVDSFEVKIKFDPATADAESLAGNCYDPAVWAREAVREDQARHAVAGFLRTHATWRKVSARTGGAYNVARLCGHNAARFDGEFLAAWFKRARDGKGEFCPGACFECLDTLQLARWFVLGVRDTDGPESLKLGAICKRLGITLEGAHDALADVRATAQLAQRLLAGMELAWPWSVEARGEVAHA